MKQALVSVFVGGHIKHFIKRTVANDGRHQGNNTDDSNKTLKYNSIDQHDYTKDCSNGTIFLPHIFLHGCSVKGYDQNYSFQIKTPNSRLPNAKRVLPGVSEGNCFRYMQFFKYIKRSIRNEHTI